MKYNKSEAKEYAREQLKGVWTALPTVFTEDDKVDEAGNSFNIERCISDLKIGGHYCLGNIGEFWSVTNEERMKVHEINVETANGRMPVHEQKVWMELIGMVGGPVRSLCSPMPEKVSAKLRADLEATGLIAKLSQSDPIPLHQAV